MSKQSERLFEAISHLNDEILDPALEPRRRKTKYHYITGNDGPLWPPVCVWWWAWCGCCLCWAGAAATMGVICATLGTAMGVPLVLIGGAVLSGVFFGDRCSPVSPSALLVAELTQTSIFDNIRAMLRTSWLRFVVTSLLYLFVGMATPHTQTSLDLAALFETEFQPDPPAVQGRPAQSGGDRHRPGGYGRGNAPEAWFYQASGAFFIMIRLFSSLLLFFAP